MAKRGPGKSSRQLLFIGNSFTARNDLPGRLLRLAERCGQPFGHRLISAGGASLRRHWNAGTALEAIRSGEYTDVVLQEQSTLPVKSAERMHESVREFDDAIQAAGARTVLYMTWARRHAPEAQDAIADAYVTIGRERGATVVPAGLAWQRFLRTHDLPVLHDKDESHPTIAGTYLAACVFLAAVFGKDSRGVETECDGLTANDTALLQATAWEAWREFSAAKKG